MKQKIEQKLKEYMEKIIYLEEEILKCDRVISEKKLTLEELRKRKTESQIDRELNTNKWKLKNTKNKSEQFEKRLKNILNVLFVLVSVSALYSIGVTLAFGTLSISIVHVLPLVLSFVSYQIVKYKGTQKSDSFDEKLCHINKRIRELENIKVHYQEYEKSLIEMLLEKDNDLLIEETIRTQKVEELADFEQEVWKILKTTNPQEDTEYVSELRESFYPKVYIPADNPVSLKYIPKEN